MKMTIYEIKRRTAKTSPYYFARKTLQFFGQTMKSFSVKKLSETRWKLSAGIFNSSGKYIGLSQRIFDSTTNRLERVD